MASKTIGERWHELLAMLGFEPEVAEAGLIVAPIAEPEQVIVVKPRRKRAKPKPKTKPRKAQGRGR